MSLTTIDIEEDAMDDAWVIAPTEACSFMALAVFARKRDATAFLKLLRARKVRAGEYDDLMILPAKAYVHVANTVGRMLIRLTHHE